MERCIVDRGIKHGGVVDYGIEDRCVEDSGAVGGGIVDSGVVECDVDGGVMER